jgi:endoglucanase
VAEGGNEEKLRVRFDEVRAWADRHGVPRRNLLLGAFGAMAANAWRGGALDAHRFFWLDAVRREAEALDAAWAYWEYSNPYGMSLTSPDESRRPDRIALDALGLLGGDQARSAGINDNAKRTTCCAIARDAVAPSDSTP